MKMKNSTLEGYFETLAIFIDYHNLEGSLRNEGHQTNILSLRDYLAEGRRLLETFVYVGFNPCNSHEDENFHRYLKMNGFIVETKSAKVRPDGSLKCDLDAELILGVVDYVLQVHPDILVLVTGDGDFAPLARWLRLRGVRVEIASTLNSLSQDLREAANGYIDLCEAIEEIQAAGEQTPVEREEVRTDGSGNHQRTPGAAPGHVV